MCGLMNLMFILNIFNIIFSSIKLREKELEILKSIGMSKRQIIKMLIIEGIFYGTIGIICGVSISIGISYLLYLLMSNTIVDTFKIAILNIIMSTIITYVIIAIIVIISQRKETKDIINKIKI
ncbi:MAG: FtsX-like permease family protein [Clostridia bacterium]|nr:FtsX-like permease family protein [Clostridia bacterium]